MLADAIESLGGTSYTVSARASNGFDVHGRAVAPTTSPSTIVGMMQPLSGREVDRLPEGLHGREARYFWTTANTLVVADSATSQVGDHVVEGSVEWEVVQHDDWTALGGYHRYTLSKVDA